MKFRCSEGRIVWNTMEGAVIMSKGTPVSLAKCNPLHHNDYIFTNIDINDCENKRIYKTGPNDDDVILSNIFANEIKILEKIDF